MVPKVNTSDGTVNQDRALKIRLMLTAFMGLAFVAVVTFVCLVVLKPGHNVVGKIMSRAINLSHGMTVGSGDGFCEWLEKDLVHLAGVVRESGGMHGELSGLKGSATGLKGSMAILKGAVIIEGEIAFLESQMEKLNANPTYTDPKLGFHIYDRNATGWLNVLYKAADVRRSLLESRLDPSVFHGVKIHQLQDGIPLYEPEPGRVPKVEEVADVLEGMTLPAKVFHGYKVYILPFSMGEISGLGSKGYMILGAPPADFRAYENQIAYTIAHEVGHHIHMTFLGVTYEENPEGWDEYMDIRGIPMWTSGGKVNSEGWFRSTEETFAEDVRVLFGTHQAAAWPFGTVYMDPREDQEVAEKLKIFIDRLIDSW
ncbi:MAG: hypothetical protein WBI64_07490 [Bacillota bacterium]